VEFVWREILLSGKVTRGGEPLPGVRLLARSPTGSMHFGGPGGIAAPSAGPQRMRAVTGSDGSYEMIVSEPGTITMSAQAAAGRKSYPPRRIEVADVESQTADLEYAAASLSGIVVDAETEAPVARASVFARPVVIGTVGGASAVTGADGRFSLDVDPGEFRLRASAEGYAEEPTTVTVGESAAADVRLPLSRGARLRGRVVGSQGRPAPGEWVIALDENDDTVSVAAESSLDGVFEFSALRPGSYRLAAGSPLSGFGILAGISPGAVDVVLRLSPGGRIRVRVKGADGAPIADAFVTVRSVNGVAVSLLGAGGRTGADGTAEIDSPAGAIEIEARKDKLSGRGQTNVAAGSLAAAEVTLTEGTPDP
jgi:hypothetical protein